MLNISIIHGQLGNFLDAQHFAREALRILKMELSPSHEFVKAAKVQVSGLQYLLSDACRGSDR